MSARLLVITNLFAEPLAPGRATYNQQQFGRLSEHLDLKILVPVSWVSFVRHPLNYWRRKQQTLARWPYADYVVFWYVPGVARSLHPIFLLASLALQRFPTLFLRRWDVLLGSWGYPDAVATVIVGKLTRTPVVVKVHGSDVNVFTRRLLHRIQIRWALNQSRAVVAVSKALASRLGEIGVNRERVTVLYNGVDPGRFHPIDVATARTQCGLAPDEEVILFVGNILLAKGCGDLLDAFVGLSSRRPHAALVYVGDGPMLKTLQAQAKARGLADRVRFEGRLPHDQLLVWFSAASVFSLPSHAEGVPNVVLEAMACGTPVVATDVGGIGEILPDFAGQLVPARSTEALEQALESVLTRQWDRARIVGHTAAFNWETNVSALQTLIEACLAS